MRPLGKNSASGRLQRLLTVCAWLLLQATSGGAAFASEIRLEIRPSATGAAVTGADWPNLVLYNTRNDGPILLWLPGTNGRPLSGPVRFYQTAIANGYRVIALSYIDMPAVSQVCFGHAAPTCPQDFREKRAFGRDTTIKISDTPDDAIVPRLKKLLIYLAATDSNGHWDQYIEAGSPRWERIAVSGHSQGGGMAAFIAKQERVTRVIMFSGGWDQAAPNRVATWYSEPSATPSSRWYGTYHVGEPYGKRIAEIYRALGIPANHTFPLDLPVSPGRDPHAQGMANPAYAPIWMRMLQLGP